MDIDERLQVSSRDGMTMVILHNTVVGDGTKDSAREKVVTIMDRRGTVLRNNLTIPMNTKEDYEWFLELHELLEQVVVKLRGW